MATAAPDGQRVAWAQADDPQTDGALRPVLRVFAGPGPERAIACRGADACVGQFFDGLWWSDSGKELFLLKRDRSAGRYATYGWTPETNRVRTVLDTEDMIAACESAGAEAICLREAATQPREIVAIDLGSGSVRTLYDPNPEFRQKAFTRVRALRWQDDFGNPVFGRLVYPRGYTPGTRYPLVVMPYGNPGFLRGDVGDEYPIHVLAHAGFMSLNMMRPALREQAELPPDEAIVFQQRHNRLRRAHLSLHWPISLINWTPRV